MLCNALQSLDLRIEQATIKMKDVDIGDELNRLRQERAQIYDALVRARQRMEETMVLIREFYASEKAKEGNEGGVAMDLSD